MYVESGWFIPTVNSWGYVTTLQLAAFWSYMWSMVLFMSPLYSHGLMHR